MGVASAVHWWEESQLRVLVLASQGVQFLLLFLSYKRIKAVHGLLRFIMWLAYLAGDAVAIYALATLFNRHKQSGSSSTLLEVVWAPVLLLHLGGQDGITAYNIEDNELWTRHLLTAVSQVTVAIYVFCKSWPRGGDRKLLSAAILLFVPGVLKCFNKPLALKAASFYSLVSSSKQRRNVGGEEMYPLEEYVKRAKAFVVEEEEAQGESASVEGGDHPLPPSSQQGSADVSNPTQDDRQRRREERNKWIKEFGEDSNKLFVDLSSPFPRRLTILQRFWVLAEGRAYDLMQQGLGNAFHLMYTSIKVTNIFSMMTSGGGRGMASNGMQGGLSADPYLFLSMLRGGCANALRICIRMLALLFQAILFESRGVLPWAAIAEFHLSHREAYTHTDVNITYALFCCTAVVEIYSTGFFMNTELGVGNGWTETVAQHSIMGYFARKKKHSWWMWIAQDFLDQHWFMRSCFSSYGITKLVHGYLRDGWKSKIEDAATYRMFNDHNSHWVLERDHCSSEGQSLSLMSMKRPFDESVLLWHLATDFCFFYGSTVSDHKCDFADLSWFEAQRRARREMAERKEARSTEMTGECAHGDGTSSFAESKSSGCGEQVTACKAVLCRRMSKYMVHLLFVNPEMLMPGSRRNLFKTANKELEAMFKDEKQPRKKGELVQRISSKIESSSPGTFIRDAWMIAQDLRRRGDAKMWEEIQGVWVEMLCFSASRCRGYLHAKALGKGGEFLSYVWLLLFHMGMETFTDKLQREEHPTPAPPLHRLSRSAPASPHRLPRYRRAAEYMV